MPSHVQLISVGVVARACFGLFASAALGVLLPPLTPLGAATEDSCPQSGSSHVGLVALQARAQVSRTLGENAVDGVRQPDFGLNPVASPAAAAHAANARDWAAEAQAAAEQASEAAATVEELESVGGGSDDRFDDVVEAAIHGGNGSRPVLPPGQSSADVSHALRASSSMPGPSEKAVDAMAEDVTMQKTLRCLGPSSASCVPCWEPNGCWVSRGQYLSVMADGEATRFVSVLHVRREELDEILISFEVLDVQNGLLRLLWDGQDIPPALGLQLPVEDRNGTFRDRLPMPEQRNGSSTVSFARAGGHELTLEFSPFGENATASFMIHKIPMASSYCSCQDREVCLTSLGSQGSEGIRLRNSNDDQKKCLSGNLPHSAACSVWRRCLQSAESSQEGWLLALLDAVGNSSSASGPEAAGNAPPRPESSNVSSNQSANGTQDTNMTNMTDGDGQSEEVIEDSDSEGSMLAFGTKRKGSTSMAMGSRDVVECLDPIVEDAASWYCDCHEDMELACGALLTEHPLVSETDCFRALFCVHHRVCTDWKDVHCHDELVTPLILALSDFGSPPPAPAPDTGTTTAMPTLVNASATAQAHEANWTSGNTTLPAVPNMTNGTVKWTDDVASNVSAAPVSLENIASAREGSLVSAMQQRALSQNKAQKRLLLQPRRAQSLEDAMSGKRCQ